MLRLEHAFDGYDTFYFCYDAETTRGLPNVYLAPNRPYDPVQFLRNLVRLWGIFRKERPDLVLSTGAEIAIPAFLVAKAMRLPTLYIEGGAQVRRRLVTGRVLVNLSDRFYVQWPELLDAYDGAAAYAGSLVDETPAGEQRPELESMRKTGT